MTSLHVQTDTLWTVGTSHTWILFSVAESCRLQHTSHMAWNSHYKRVRLKDLTIIFRTARGPKGSALHPPKTKGPEENSILCLQPACLRIPPSCNLWPRRQYAGPSHCCCVSRNGKTSHGLPVSRRWYSITINGMTQSMCFQSSLMFHKGVIHSLFGPTRVWYGNPSASHTATAWLFADTVQTTPDLGKCKLPTTTAYPGPCTLCIPTEQRDRGTRRTI